MLNYDDLEKVPLAVNSCGEGPVPDEEAAFFMCMGCGQKWPCEPEHHIKEMVRQYG